MSKRVCSMKSKAAKGIALWIYGSSAGRMPHTGSIWSCQAKGPGFSFLKYPPDSLPHLVSRGEFRTKFQTSCFILPTWCHTCPEAFLQLYSSSVLSQHFSIYYSVVKSDWHVILKETKPPPPPCAGTYMHTLNFFLYLLYGIPTFKKKKKKRI